MKLLKYLLLNLFSLNLFVRCQPYDLINKANVDHNFVSIGSTYIDDKQWYTLTTQSNQFIKDTALFVTIPQITGHNPAVVKMKQQTTLNADKTVTFSIKIVQPNDSYCSKSFGWTPEYLPLTQVSWMVFELGAYTIQGYTFIAGKGTITRNSWSTSATFTNLNLIAISFPTGCISSTESCILPDVSRGAISLLQTNNNVKEVGKDLYLTVRSKQIDQRRGQWVLIPHDVSPFATSYHILSAETLGYLAFPIGAKIDCFEKVIWETTSILRNYVPGTVTFSKTYDYPPGLFGMVGTITSLCDTVLVSSGTTTTSGTFAINEDQCAKSEYTHTTSENIFLVVVGQQSTTDSTYQCFMNFDSGLTPIAAPSPLPTFTLTPDPTKSPSVPTFPPTQHTTTPPSRVPTRQLTSIPPTRSPTRKATSAPSRAPTRKATSTPTRRLPSHSPTRRRGNPFPTQHPTRK